MEERADCQEGVFRQALPRLHITTADAKVVAGQLL